MLGGYQETAKNEDRLLQEDFLDLLVTQLQNQDPFKPMESGEFLGQLAQFGTVSGIGDLESAFRGLADSLTSSQALQAANLVDRQVLLASNIAPLNESGSMHGAVELPSAAEQVTVGVHDASGRLVKKLSLGKQTEGLAQFSWDGFGDDGKRAADGLYELRAEVITAGATQAVDVLVGARVKSVTLGRLGEPASVEIPGLGSVDFAQIRQIS